MYSQVPYEVFHYSTPNSLDDLKKELMKYELVEKGNIMYERLSKPVPCFERKAYTMFHVLRSEFSKRLWAEKNAIPNEHSSRAKVISNKSNRVSSNENNFREITFKEQTSSNSESHIPKKVWKSTCSFLHMLVFLRKATKLLFISVRPFQFVLSTLSSFWKKTHKLEYREKYFEIHGIGDMGVTLTRCVTLLVYFDTIKLYHEFYHD